MLFSLRTYENKLKNIKPPFSTERKPCFHGPLIGFGARFLHA